MSDVIPLERPHASKTGAPVVSAVDPKIFQLRYFTHCMECTFCHDVCCQYGVDVDASNVERLLAHADALEAYTGMPRTRWFRDDAWREDPDFPSGRHTRTQVVDGACVFRNRRGRGCLVHSYCLENGLDYHTLKPMISTLFPLTFDAGVMLASTETVDGTLICLDQGPTLYRAQRDEVRHYFGDALVGELDAIEARLTPP